MAASLTAGASFTFADGNFDFSMVAVRGGTTRSNSIRRSKKVE
jgi:hypothetical protein